MKTMLWKFYFLVILSLDMIAFSMPRQRRLLETIDMGIFLIALFGLLGYCWSKQLLIRLFWWVFLACLLVWIGFYTFVLRPIPRGLIENLIFREPFGTSNIPGQYPILLVYRA
jgi:hypothetical protein